MPSSEEQIDPAKWVDAHGDYLYTYAYYRVNNKEMSADLVQDTFVAALKSSKKFRGESSERTWLVAILKRKIIDYYRRQATRKTTTGEADEPFDERGQWKTESAPSGFQEASDEYVQREEFYRILQWCMQMLPDKWEAVFRMKNLEELKSSEICNELDISSSNLWVILHRARLQLRECLEKNW